MQMKKDEEETGGYDSTSGESKRGIKGDDLSELLTKSLVLIENLG